MGGFHQPIVMQQKMLYKRYACLGYRTWFIDSKVIADGSVDMAVEGRHYYRCMRVLKESFNALIQYRVEGETFNCEIILHSCCIRLAFQQLYDAITNYNGTQSQLTVSYLHIQRDVLPLITLIIHDT